LPGELHDAGGGGVDGKIDAEALASACGQQWSEQLAVVLLRDSLMDEADAALVEQASVLVLGIDDNETSLVEGEMTFNEGKRAFADRTKSDHDNGTVDTGMHRPTGHGSLLQYDRWNLTSAPAAEDWSRKGERAALTSLSSCRATAR